MYRNIPIFSFIIFSFLLIITNKLYSQIDGNTYLFMVLESELDRYVSGTLDYDRQKNSINTMEKDEFETSQNFEKKKKRLISNLIKPQSRIADYGININGISLIKYNADKKTYLCELKVPYKFVRETIVSNYKVTAFLNQSKRKSSDRNFKLFGTSIFDHNAHKITFIIKNLSIPEAKELKKFGDKYLYINMKMNIVDMRIEDRNKINVWIDAEITNFAKDIKRKKRDITLESSTGNLIVKTTKSLFYGEKFNERYKWIRIYKGKDYLRALKDARAYLVTKEFYDINYIGKKNMDVELNDIENIKSKAVKNGGYIITYQKYDKKENGYYFFKIKPNKTTVLTLNFFDETKAVFQEN